MPNLVDRRAEGESGSARRYVDKKTVHKYEKESAQAGKASFSWAWLLDERSEERARGEQASCEPGWLLHLWCCCQHRLTTTSGTVETCRMLQAPSSISSTMERSAAYTGPVEREHEVLCNLLSGAVLCRA